MVGGGEAWKCTGLVLLVVCLVNPLREVGCLALLSSLAVAIYPVRATTIHRKAVFQVVYKSVNSIDLYIFGIIITEFAKDLVG